MLLEAVEDDGVLFSREQRAKRFTAEQCEKLEWKENAVLELLARDCPVHRIAALLSVSTHTIQALGSRNAEKVATFSQSYADQLLKKGARLMARGLLREEELTPFQAITCGAIMTDKAVVVSTSAGMGLGGGKEFVKEDVDRAEAVRRLRALMAAPEAPEAAPEGVEAPGEGAGTPDQGAGELGRSGEERAQTPQPVVSCGAKTCKPLDITLEEYLKSDSKPA